MAEHNGRTYITNYFVWNKLTHVIDDDTEAVLAVAEFAECRRTCNALQVSYNSRSTTHTKYVGVISASKIMYIATVAVRSSINMAAAAI